MNCANVSDEEIDALVASIDRTPIATVITDHRKADYPILAANDAFCALTGYPRAEIVGRNCRFLGGERTEQEARAKLRDAIARDDRTLVELTNFRKDGSRFRNVVMIAPLRDADGKTAFYLGSQMELRSDTVALSRRARAAELVETLTPRQRDVLRMMSTGLRNKQIAGELGIDETTVKMHRARLLERLGVPTSADAIRIAVEAGV